MGSTEMRPQSRACFSRSFCFKMQEMKLLRDVAIRHLLTIEPHDSLRRTAKAMSDRGVGAAVVMEAGNIAGIVTERDILLAVAANRDFDSDTVDHVMTRDVVSGKPGWDIMRAVRTMIEHNFRHLLVTEMHEPVGIVSLRDLMDSMAELVQDDIRAT